MNVHRQEDDGRTDGKEPCWGDSSPQPPKGFPTLLIQSLDVRIDATDLVYVKPPKLQGKLLQIPGYDSPQIQQSEAFPSPALSAKRPLSQVIPEETTQKKLKVTHNQSLSLERDVQQALIRVSEGLETVLLKILFGVPVRLGQTIVQEVGLDFLSLKQVSPCAIVRDHHEVLLSAAFYDQQADRTRR